MKVRGLKRAVKDGVALTKQLEPTKFPKTKLADKVWFAGFIKRHHKLILREPELTSLTTVSGLKNVVVHTIFDVLENIVDENKIPNPRIFTMD
jgi:hypothetical protein